MVKALIELAERKGAKKDINDILKTPSKSSHRTGKPRIYRDLVEKRFDITKVIRIERSDDIHDIANKWCDFSLDTVTTLFNQGIKDAKNTLRQQES